MRRVRTADCLELGRWYSLQAEKPPSVALPKVGLIEDGVAAGFLYQADGGLGLIDGYVSNPEASSTERHKALNEITVELMRIANENGITNVIALTKDPSIAIRATMHGFKDLGLYCLFTKEV